MLGFGSNLITSVSIDPATNLVGFSASNLSFDASHISLNFAGLLYDPSRLVQVDVNTATAAPEPGSFLLIGFGVGGLALAKRRTRLMN